jgi:anaerobic selenocysteine-containing dehydrogenase/Fe-S-cluster-containing dehydrogenase component
MPEGLSRRTFLKLAATAGAAASVPGCEPAARKLIPYVVPDENVIPGVPSFYATTCMECSAGCGLIATVRDGRTTFLAGNPADPISMGSTCPRGEAGLQGLYNPDRLRHPMVRSGNKLKEISWDDAHKMLADHVAAAAKAGKDRVAFLGEPAGPTIGKIVRTWLGAAGSSRALFYESISNEPARSAGNTLFGRRDLPVYRIDKGEVLISFGYDFLESDNIIELGRQFAAFRVPQQRRGELTMGRSFLVGPRMSLTAGRSDKWIMVAPGDEAQIAWSVLHVLVAQRWVSQNSGVDLNALTTMVAAYEPSAVSQRTGVPADVITKLGEAFGKADGATALASPTDESAVLAAYLLNAVTGNVGRTMMFLDGAPPEAATPPDEIASALTDMRDGKVDVLVVHRANPVFTMAPPSRAPEALQKVPFVAWCGTVPDETAEMATLLLPAHHPLEEWRDTFARAGVHGLGQPVLQPVMRSQPIGEILLASLPAGSSVPWKTQHDAVKAEWGALAPKTPPAPGTVDFWTQVRRDGGYFPPAQSAAVKLNLANLRTPAPIQSQAELTFVTYPHIFFGDGRGADKPWLQELPEPVSQIVWDTWAEIHPSTAQKLGVNRPQTAESIASGSVEVIELRTEHGAIEVPVLLTPRIHPGTIAVALGQGHTSYGRYATGRGANPWRILASGSYRIAVQAKPTGKSHELALATYGSDGMGRGIVQAMSVADLAKGGEPKEPPLAPMPYEMYEHFPYKRMWGMTIDANACIGCSACITACYAENNVAVVGKENVRDQRIMSWIRLERYFPQADAGEDQPQLYLAPMLCQQCNHAPCEPVCPVFAAYHTQEGLNGQIYNRCVGTRYCENNCPYKVRRFNWWKYDVPSPLELQLNPDVTVRGDGVMEKCTFCVQRIQKAEITARIEKRELRDGEIVTACEGACPTHAISFGDMLRKDSLMMKRRDENKARNYKVLVELNTQPAVVYLKDLFNEKGNA